MAESTRNGFMLAEALVGLAIVAMMAALVFSSVWQLGRTAADAAARRDAMLLARSVLAAATVPSANPPIAPRGQDGGFAWRLVSEPHEAREPGGQSLSQITVTISDRHNGAVLARLDGMRTGS